MQQHQSSIKRNLTPLYCLHQAAYYFATAGISAFAVTYLMARGFDTSVIGILLAASNILSSFLQPAIGNYVDRTSISRLQIIIPGCLIASFILLGAIEWVALPMTFIALFYILGYLTFSITLPLCNSLCAYYTGIGSRVNYGVGSGVGSIAFSFGSLSFGYIIAQLGAPFMIYIAQLALVLQIVLVMRYPRIRSGAQGKKSADHTDSLSLLGFLRCYKLFMLTMVGVMCLAACHAMAENYLIQIFTRIGGGSEHVGVTLFLACITSAPAQFYFERIQKHISVSILLRLSGVFFVAKAVLLIFASSIVSVYLICMLQTFTYVFAYPPLYYLALQRIAPKDMAKGQTLPSSMFTLGIAIGNSIGGIVLTHLGLNPMLAIAAGIAAVGTVLINATIGKKDAPV